MAVKSERRTVGGCAGHRNGQVEGEHPRKVHRPNSQSHRGGSSGQPSRADPTARGGYASPPIKCRVGRGDGDENGERDEAKVV